MGLIDGLMNVVFGGRGLAGGVKDVAEVFRPNAEAADARGADVQSAALAQLAAEFTMPKKGLFDRVIDGLNRIPRPAMALGVLALFVAAMVDPIWFAERMNGLALVPEPLWWLLGAIVSFYFGARHQVKAQDFQRSLATTVASTPAVVANMRTLRAMRPDSPGAAAGTEDDVPDTDDNPAIARFLEGRGS
jgi:hypothetical protein